MISVVTDGSGVKRFFKEDTIGLCIIIHLALYTDNKYPAVYHETLYKIVKHDF